MKWKSLILAASILVNVGLVSFVVLGHDPMTPVFISEAQAQLRSVGGGGYVVVAARSSSNDDAVWIIDNREKRLNIYQEHKKSVVRVASVDLRAKFGANLAGDLIMMPAMISSSTEAVYVIDPVGKKMVAFVLGRKGAVGTLGARDLDVDFKK